MKSALPLSLALLLTLTACGGQSAAPSSAESAAPAAATAAPAPALPLPAEPAAEAVPLSGETWQAAPLPVDPAELSQTPVSDRADVEYLMYDTGAQAALVAQLPELDADLYAYWGGGYEEESILLRVGDDWAAYPIHWWSGRGLLPQLHAGDFDGDGAAELALLAYTGAGTGVSSWTLCLVELEEGLPACILPDLAYEYDLSSYLGCTFQKSLRQAVITLGGSQIIADLSEYDLTDDSPLEAYTGTIVEYAVDGDTITVQLAVGLYGKGLPYTVCYFCQLEGQLAYKDGSFSLTGPALVPYPDGL